MSLIYNGTEITSDYDIVYNGTSLTKVIYNDEVVWEKQTEFTGLCFTANTAGSTITLGKIGSPSWTGYYSTDGSTWISYVPGTTGAITLTNAGDKVYFKGTLGSYTTHETQYLQFSMSGSIAASGNIMSLCSGDDYASIITIPFHYIFFNLFRNCASLTTAPSLPATTLAAYCYNGMFLGCTSLTTAPELPATTLANNCYAGMFAGCTSLTTAPVLPSINLKGECYQGMFLGCTSLTTAPELPATTLVQYCYNNMFYDCTSLTTAPSLPATTLAQYCYHYMFHNCTSLYVSDTPITGTAEQAWRIPTNAVASGSYTMSNMFYGCLGTRSTDSPNFNGIQKTYYTQNTPV